MKPLLTTGTARWAEHKAFQKVHAYILLKRRTKTVVGGQNQAFFTLSSLLIERILRGV